MKVVPCIGALYVFWRKLELRSLLFGCFSRLGAGHVA